MGSFNRGGSSDRGRSFGGKREFGNRGYARPTMHKAICDKCGKECDLPFRPTEGKPVFCRDCFREMGNGRTDTRRPDERSLSRLTIENRPMENPQYKEQFAALNSKLDKVLTILTSAIAAGETQTENTEIEQAPMQSKEEVTSEKKKRSPKKTL